MNECYSLSFTHIGFLSSTEFFSPMGTVMGEGFSTMLTCIRVLSTVNSLMLVVILTF